MAVTALTETLTQFHMFSAGATSIGVMTDGTLASRDRAARSALALMDLEDIPRQYASAQALGA